MTFRRMLVELSIGLVIVVIAVCLTTPDGFHKLAVHVAGLVG